MTYTMALFDFRGAPHAQHNLTLKAGSLGWELVFLAGQTPVAALTAEVMGFPYTIYGDASRELKCLRHRVVTVERAKAPRHVHLKLRQEFMASENTDRVVILGDTWSAKRLERDLLTPHLTHHANNITQYQPPVVLRLS